MFAPKSWNFKHVYHSLHLFSAAVVVVVVFLYRLFINFESGKAALWKIAWRIIFEFLTKLAANCFWWWKSTVYTTRWIGMSGFVHLGEQEKINHRKNGISRNFPVIESSALESFRNPPESRHSVRFSFENGIGRYRAKGSCDYKEIKI